VASSADGMRLAAVADGANVWTSTVSNLLLTAGQIHEDAQRSIERTSAAKQVQQSSVLPTYIQWSTQWMEVKLQTGILPRCMDGQSNLGS